MIIVACLFLIYLIYKVSQLERMVKKQQSDVEEMKSYVKVIMEEGKRR
ncbi:hypothetical protein H0266_14210 [Halobacillus locisalis]|uniref:Uncharacterized protein n=1 Tax=Halobacillus locisalis TaxID=220753 RepID=A0A838CVF5_9BACI|nr:hypothetical protein [Halobacillus locisalis]MBA2176047.1 hypothetical protein [Halobacillus locisalis]